MIQEALCRFDLRAEANVGEKARELALIQNSISRVPGTSLKA